MSKRRRAAGGLVTRVALARLLGVSPMTVSKWIDDAAPVAVRGRAGVPSLYDPVKVRAWKAARDSASAGGAVGVAAARAAKESAQARLAEQTYEARAGSLLPAEAVAQVWSAHIAAVRTRLVAWPQVLADRLARACAVDGVAGVERELEAAVRAVLAELADSPLSAEQERALLAEAKPS